LAVSPSNQSQAFTTGSPFTSDNHEEITRVLSTFLRSGVYDEIKEQGHDWADDKDSPRVNEPSIHADDCAFSETATQINSFHARAVAKLVPGDHLDPWAASDEFGRSLHPIQDFYSHSNWVELGFPVAQTARASDLVDFSTRLAGANGLGKWATPGPLGQVRGNIRSADFVTPRRFRFHSASGFLRALDANGDPTEDAAHATVADFPAGWRVGLLPHPTQPGKAGFVPGIDTNGDGQFTSLSTHGPRNVPILRNGADLRLLISGVGGRPDFSEDGSVFKNQCDPYVRDAAGQRAQPLTVNSCALPPFFPDHYSCIAYYGSRFALTHDGSDDSELRKDKHADGPTRFPKAKALATLQTAYEWCRLVNRAEQTRGADGVLLALWVKEGRSPHPQNTPCAPADRHVPVGVRVTVDRVRILQDKDNDEDEPGEINVSLALYDPPSRFHQSVKSAVGPLYADDNGGADSILAKLPGSVRFCPGPTGRFRVALHGWDDDEGGDAGKGAGNGDYNRDNSTPDDVLTGFTDEHSITDVPPAGQGHVIRTKVSEDMVVTYRLTRTVGCANTTRQAASTTRRAADTLQAPLLLGLVAVVAVGVSLLAYRRFQR
jgi:hypothetical protein